MALLDQSVGLTPVQACSFKSGFPSSGGLCTWALRERPAWWPAFPWLPGTRCTLDWAAQDLHTRDALHAKQALGGPCGVPVNQACEISLVVVCRGHKCDPWSENSDQYALAPQLHGVWAPKPEKPTNHSGDPQCCNPNPTQINK